MESSTKHGSDGATSLRDGLATRAPGRTGVSHPDSQTVQTTGHDWVAGQVPPSIRPSCPRYVTYSRPIVAGL